MLKLTRGAALLMVCFLFFAACKRESAEEKETEEEIFQKAVKGVSAVEDRYLKLTITGDIQVTFEGTHKMQFYARPFGKRERALERPGIEALAQASVATVSTRTPFVYAPSRGVVVGISVVGNYTGDGSYKITKRDPSSLTPGPTSQSTSLSIVRLELFDMDRDVPTSIDRVDTDEQPCRVTLKNDAKQGTLSCPLITDQAGARKVTVTMSWGPPR